MPTDTQEKPKEKSGFKTSPNAIPKQLRRYAIRQFLFSTMSDKGFTLQQLAQDKILNPLTVISLSAEDLKRGEITPDENFKIVQEQTQRIKDFLS